MPYKTNPQDFRASQTESQNGAFKIPQYNQFIAAILSSIPTIQGYNTGYVIWTLFIVIHDHGRVAGVDGGYGES